MIAGVFPSYEAFVARVREGFEAPASEFPPGPFLAGHLTYRSARAVVYRTPKEAEGLGTESWLGKNEDPIDGVAILVGETPDLLHAAIRLPARLRWLAPSIIRQVERR